MAFSAPYPGTIISLDWSTLPQGLMVQEYGFLVAARGAQMSLHFNQKSGAGLFGGDGKVFVHAGGAIIEKGPRPDSVNTR